jgi:hypothetical protein
VHQCHEHFRCPSQSEALGIRYIHADQFDFREPPLDSAEVAGAALDLEGLKRAS